MNILFSVAGILWKNVNNNIYVYTSMDVAYLVKLCILCMCSIQSLKEWVGGGEFGRL